MKQAIRQAGEANKILRVQGRIWVAGESDTKGWRGGEKRKVTYGRWIMKWRTGESRKLGNTKVKKTNFKSNQILCTGKAN